MAFKRGDGDCIILQHWSVTGVVFFRSSSSSMDVLAGDTVGVLWGSECRWPVCADRRWWKFHAAEVQQPTSLCRLRHSVQASWNGPAGLPSTLLSVRCCR